MWKYYNPVEIIQGTYQDLERYIPQTDGMLLLVTTKGMVERHVAQSFMETFSASLTWHIYEAKPNPELDILDEATRNLLTFAQKNKQSFTAVIALGGGSVIDTAKALACTLAVPNLEMSNLLHTWIREKSKKPENVLPLFVLPTTAGTGAEVTPFATMWDTENQKKYSLTSPLCFPKLAILDPALSLTLPWKETLYGALDALSHALESFWNKTATPISLMYAEKALNSIATNFPLLEKNPQDIQLRALMQEAALFAGIAISQNHSSLSHAMSYPLTLHHQIPHGLACSVFLLPILEFVDKKNMFPYEVKNLVYQFLTHYAPHQILRTQVQECQVKALVDEMFHPERANTFILPIEKDDVLDIIEKTFNM